MAPIGVLGVPTNSAGTTVGVARAPVALREAGLIEALRERGEVRDHGDLALADPTPGRDQATQLIDPRGLASMVTRVRDAVASIRSGGEFPLVIGGDCPVLLGCLAAEAAPLGLLFVDGHEDAYPPERSATGEAADVELAIALGFVRVPWSPELDGLLPLVAPEDVRILGARDAARLQTEEVPSIGDRVRLVDADRLSADPIGLTRLASSFAGPWWLHVDLDVLSTEALPAVDYPQDGGLDWEELEAVTRTALGAGPIGWDLTIYNPDLDPERLHARRIVRFLASALGSTVP